jgi:hemerythrin-like metal-binding protein
VFGDIVLREIAARTVSILRVEDLLFRWGGEEFLILAPHTDLVGATAIAEKLRLAIADNTVEQVGKVTASFGVAERSFGESRDDWFRRVDGLLYQAKRHGRNRVESRETGGGDVPERIHIGWQKDWESGVLQIDHAHRNIIRMGSTLLNLSLTGCPTEQMLGHLDTLLEYIEGHIEDEERTLEEIGYPDLEEHRKMHAGLLREARELRKQYLTGTVKPAETFLLLVNRIIIEHIIKADALYYRFTR